MINRQSTLGPIRPPSEAFSLLIRVTEGCTWNRCEFCSVFKGQKFRVRPLEDVKADILAVAAAVEDVYRWAERSGYSVSDVARLNGIIWLQEDGVKSAFLQDSDSLATRTDHLAEVVEFLCGAFPTLERVCSYSRGKTVFRKKPEELRRLRQAGLSRLHIGLETGDDELLAYVQKGATAEEMILAGQKAVAAGFEVSEYFMPGLGGQEKWQQHVRNSVRVLNQINPAFIRFRTFHPAPGTTMHERAQRQEYHVQSIEGVLTEVRTLVEQLDVTSQLVASDFSWNFYMGEVDGKLPEDRERLLGIIDRALDYWRAKGEPERNPFIGDTLGPLN